MFLKISGAPAYWEPMDAGRLLCLADHYCNRKSCKSQWLQRGGCLSKLSCFWNEMSRFGSVLKSSLSGRLLFGLLFSICSAWLSFILESFWGGAFKKCHYSLFFIFPRQTKWQLSILLWYLIYIWCDFVSYKFLKCGDVINFYWFSIVFISLFRLL